MRFERKLDNIAWYLIMFLPLATYLLQCINGTPSLPSIITDLGTGNIWQPVKNAIDQTGLVINNTLWSMSTWAISAYMVHMLTDMLLFLPKVVKRLIHSTWRDTQ